MKKIFFPVIAFVFLVFITSCSEKFKVAAPYKNITVVFGMLDQRDTAHYVRIQKAFLDEDKSAVTMAQSPDSNFYSSLNVRIERYDFNNHYHDSIHLNRVDLNNEGYPKQAGAFFNAPNYAYKFTNFLDPNYIYRLKCINLATGVIDSANAPIIEDSNLSVTSPAFYVYVIDDQSGNRAGLDFAATGTNKRVEFQGRYTPINNFNFNGSSSPVLVAQLFIRFNWKDSSIITHEKTPHSYDFNAGYITLLYSNFNYVIDDINLYKAMATALGKAETNIQRLIDRCDITVYLGTQDFSTYEQTSAVQGTGLTGSEIEPIYTNIQGPNTLGLFTSRGKKSGRLTITLNTIDSLKAHPLLAGANIRGTAY